MIPKSNLVFVAMGVIPIVAAHGRIFFYHADGVDYNGFGLDLPTAAWPSDNVEQGGNFIGFVPGQPSAPTAPIPFSLHTIDAICGTNAVPGNLSAVVSAGGSITFDQTQWPSNHFGPIMMHLANCHGPCETVDKTKLRWFKIAEKGLVNKTLKGSVAGYDISGTWAAPDLLNANRAGGWSPWTVRIPATLAAGNYVVRHEIIALHYEQNGEIQYYPFCFNFKVTGSGTVNPTGFTQAELYHANDPGFHYDPFVFPLKDYIIPGAPLAQF